MRNKTKKILKLIFASVIIIVAAVLISFLLTPFERSYSAEHISSGKKQIALTFDDGPGEYTDELLNGLRERNVKASFFLQGRKLEGREEIVKTMYEDGHLIGCHTWSHINFLKCSVTEIRAEIEKTNDKIESITGQRPQFFRPPYGYYLGSQLNRIDSIAVLWSATPRDWVNTDADYICDWLVSHLRDGDIVLLHDTKAATVPAVLRAINILQAEGYEFVRVDELLCRNGDRLAPGLGYRYCPYDSRAWYF